MVRTNRLDSVVLLLQVPGRRTARHLPARLLEHTVPAD